MSVRFIGCESYVPTTPGNYTRGKTKIIKINTEHNEQEEKCKKIQRYKEQLDLQVQEDKKRKQDKKRKEEEEDLKRQRQFYDSLGYSKVSPEKSKNSYHSPKNYHYADHQNPEQHENQSALQISRISVKRGPKFDIFHSRSQLVDDKQEYGWGQYSYHDIEKRRKSFIEEMDRSLMDAYLAIERSKHTDNSQLNRICKRLKVKEIRMPTDYGTESDSFGDPLYNLPSSGLSMNRYRGYNSWN